MNDVMISELPKLALEANSGEERWTYDPHVPRAKGRDACCDVVNRGVALWKGRVYVATIDGRLIANDQPKCLARKALRRDDIILLMA